MSKRKKLRDQRSVRHVSVLDAAQVIAGARSFAALAGEKWLPEADRRGRAVTKGMLDVWETSPVVLRVDHDFANALLDSNADVEIAPEFLKRIAFDALAYSFPRPISLHDGKELCHYIGFLAVGLRQHPETVRMWGAAGSVVTEYLPFRNADGVRFMWIFTAEGNPTPRAQQISLDINGALRPENGPRTLTEYIEWRLMDAEDKQYGEELPTLVPLSMQLLLYLAAQQPDDLDWPAPETISRPQQIQTARIGNIGWRIGAAVRAYRQEHTTATGTTTGGGWALPPHIRKAHWHRVRVAERDESGAIVGRREGGVQDVDWHYEWRLYPPTPVNADERGRVAPAVRTVATD